MRVGIDARLWSQTGVGRYIRNVLLELSNLDKKNQYFVFLQREDFNKVSFPSNFQKVLTDIKWHTLEEQIKLPNILNKYNLDLVHFPYYSVPIFYKRPFIVTLHDLIPLHFQTGKASTLPFPFYKLKFFVYRFVVSQAAKNATKIIAPSNATKIDIVKYLKVPSPKIQVIYEGTDEGLKNKKSQKKKNEFLYVGNAYPHKNLEFLTEVFRTLPKDYKLIMVGKEDHFYRRLKRDVRKINLQDKIKFFGQATDSQLSELYKKSKALIMPSFIEGFGLPALEAMANSCLVIASDIPVFHEVYQDSAVYFDPNDPSDLSQKLKQAFANKYQDNIEKGLKRVKNFSWEKTAKETLKIYESSISLRQG